ncbi:PREDICTED: uncharacterized protein LOC102024665 isoform X2 [Chinchilla lanigera]|uniref:uncharacterized protein LOC102024665 isoform X2 n=1 Tax=Chinchilla lanigera TaxID=34839 RepID=UPI00038EC747|nr:PREDICTED: uncharacterized protein LOC102024665 isoform X2 [Chinchilla lanigera]
MTGHFSWPVCGQSPHPKGFTLPPGVEAPGGLPRRRHIWLRCPCQAARRRDLSRLGSCGGSSGSFRAPRPLAETHSSLLLVSTLPELIALQWGIAKQHFGAGRDPPQGGLGSWIQPRPSLPTKGEALRRSACGPLEARKPGAPAGMRRGRGPGSRSLGPSCRRPHGGRSLRCAALCPRGVSSLGKGSEKQVPSLCDPHPAQTLRTCPS